MIKCRLTTLLLATFGFSLLSFTALAQSISPDMIEKAKAAGVSQQQIDAAMKQQSATAGSTPVLKPVIPITTVDRNVKGDSIYKSNSATVNAAPSEVLKKAMVFGREIFSQKNLTFAPNSIWPRQEATA